MIHARLDLSKSRSTAVGTFTPDGVTAEVWFMAEGVTVPNEADEIEPGKDSLMLCLSLSDAFALSTLLDQSIVACINSRGRVN
jgi:hypothetical protein